MLAQAKGPYKLEQAMGLEHWLSQIDSRFKTGIDLLIVPRLNKVTLVLPSSTEYLARIFRTEALHWYSSRAARDLITRSMYLITRVDPISDATKKS